MDMSSIHKFDKNSKVLIDTNILLFVFYPLNTNQNKVSKYSVVLEKLRENSSQLFVSSLVISEFINRWLRMDFEKNFLDDERTKEFKKDYRVSDTYKKTINLILKTIKKIYKNYNIKNIDDSYVNFNILDKYKNIYIDFNDLILIHIAERNNLKILTDDKDLINIKELTI